MSIDYIGDFLTIIRNSVLLSKPFVYASHSNMRLAVALILKDEGFIRDVFVEEEEGRKYLKVLLKYVEGESVIHEIKRISTPGSRKYVKKDAIKPVIGGLGISILTTGRGIVSHKQAKEYGVGGEIICTVW